MSKSDTTTAPAKKPGYWRLLRVVRWVLTGLVGIVLLVSLVIGALLVFDVTLDLSASRQRIESIASQMLQRSVHIDGPVRLLPSLRPTLGLEGLRVGQPRDWPDTDFARLGRIEVQLAIMPLFRQEFIIDGIEVEGLDVTLETNSAGEGNWIFPTRDSSSPRDSAVGIPYLEIDSVEASGISVTYRDARVDRQHSLQLTSLTGEVTQWQGVRLSVEGNVQDLPFQAGFSGGGLADLATPGKPWPVDLSFEALGADLHAKGSVQDVLDAVSFSLAVELDVPSTEEIKELAGIVQPIFEKIELQARLEGSPGVFSVEDMEASLGDTPFSARVRADFSGAKPRFDGSVRADYLDVGPLFKAIGEGDYSDDETAVASRAQPAAGRSDDAEGQWELDAPFVDTALLDLFDARLEFSVDEILGGPSTITGTSLALDVSGGSLRAPSTVQFAGVPFTGEINVSAGDDVSTISLSLAAESSEIGDLAELLMDAKGVDGRFDKARLDFSSKGKTLRELVQSSELDFALESASMTYGNESGSRPVEFVLDRFEMKFRADRESRVSARGALLDEPFSLDIRGGSFTQKFVTGYWPVTIEFNGGGAQFNANGQVAPQDETQLDFDLSGASIGDMSGWLGIAPESDYAYQLKGEATISDVMTRLLITHGQMADSRIRAEIGIVMQDGQPLSQLELHSDRIDLDSFLSLFPESESTQEVSQTEKYRLDAPILPKGINLLDSDIDITIASLQTRLLEIEDFGFSTRIRDGYVASAPIQAVIAGTLLQGNLEVDLRSVNARLAVAMQAGAIDLGKLLTTMELVDAMSLTAQGFDLALQLEGASLRDLLAGHRLVASVQGGLWEINNYKLSRDLDVVLDKGRFVANGGEQIRLDIEGRIDETPLTMSLQTDPLASFMDRGETVAIGVEVNLAQTDIRLSTKAGLPLETDRLQFDLDLEGERFDKLDELLGVALPPWGPYALRGEFSIGSSGYSVHNLHMRVGESNLDGDIELVMAREPPLLTVGLSAETIQLDDFKTGDWSLDGEEDEEDEEDEVEEIGGLAKAEARVTDKLAMFTPEFMRRLDAGLELRVEEVVSGKDRLGNGALSATLEDGRVVIDPLSLGVPGGEVKLALALEPTETDVAMRLDALIENLDYGYIARRIDPESSVSGLISVDVHLSTRGPELDTVMRHANGNIDFAIWPQEINARIFDLWSTNLMAFVFTRMDQSAESRVNCLVTRFRLVDGFMEPNVIFIDTTRVQAGATGMIDLKERSLEFRIRPRPKRPEFFSAQTTLRVRGSFDDFSAGASAGAIAGSVVRIITSPIVVPFQRMFSEQPSVDGEYECREAWERDFDAPG